MENYQYQNYRPGSRQPYKFDTQRCPVYSRPPTNLGFSQDDAYQDVDIEKVNGQLLDNIAEYNKNLTQDEINGTNVSNILKFNNLMTLSEFDKMMIADQYHKLYNKNRETNDLLAQEHISKRFVNMPLAEIFNTFQDKMIDIIDEIPDAFKKDAVDATIFTKDDRLPYVGIFFVLISLLVYFMNVTS